MSGLGSQILPGVLSLYGVTCPLVYRARPLFRPTTITHSLPHAKKGLAKVSLNEIFIGQSDSAFEIHANNLRVGVE